MLRASHLGVVDKYLVRVVVYKYLPVSGKSIYELVVANQQKIVTDRQGSRYVQVRD